MDSAENVRSTSRKACLVNQQSPMTLYVFLACSLFCVTALVVVALTDGSAAAVGSISAIWAATCGVLGFNGRRAQ